jgi:hypothetical protein
MLKALARLAQMPIHSPLRLIPSSSGITSECEPRTNPAAGSPESETRMLSRSYTPTGFSQRSAAQRRLRRSAASRRLFCSTNGCATFMLPDPDGASATCPICGKSRRLSAAPLRPVVARPH